MHIPIDVSEPEIALLCSLMQPYCQRGRVVYVGSLAEKISAALGQVDVTGGAALSGSAARFSAVTPDRLPLAEPATAQDFLVLEQAVLEDMLTLALDGFSRQFGTPAKLLLLLFPSSGKVLLPRAAKLFSRLGYTRDFSVGLWSEDRIYACAFDHQSVDENSIEAYEEEWWRSTLLNQKRRRLLQDYLQELTQTTHAYERKLREQAAELSYRVVELENRWDAFQNSRTGQFVRLMGKLRRLLPF
jgi:hypothetical protein